MTYYNRGDKRIILNWLKSLRETGDGWIEEYKIRAINTPFGWIGARGDRNVRDLIKSGNLEADKRGKFRIVRYKFQEPIKILTEEEKVRQYAMQGLFG